MPSIVLIFLKNCWKDGLKETNMKEDIEQVEKLLERHIKWLNNLPTPTQGCLHQMMNVIGEAQRILTKVKNEMEKHKV